MKKNIWLVIMSLIPFLLACKKSQNQSNPPSAQSYIKFKLENTLTECSTLITASYYPSVPDSQISISGAWSTGSIRIEISGSNSALTPGAYVFANNKLHSGHIFTNNPAGRFVAGMDLFLNVYNGSGKIIISEISPQFVKGTFEFVTGTDPSNPSLPIKTVTSGEFYVKRG